MARENTHNAIILKKQPYNEGDEILTLYTEEAGKIRSLGKSTKLAKSKLQHALQTCFFVKIELAGKGLAKIIGAEVVNTFPNIRKDLTAAKTAFYALEAVLKATPDEQKNERLFHLLVMFFTFLDLCETHGDLIPLGLAKFKIQFLQDLGLAITAPNNLHETKVLGFSPSRGGFVNIKESSDYMEVSLKTIEQFSALEALEFSQIISRNEIGPVLQEPIDELQNLLSIFINYQLEREIKSGRYI